MPAVLAYIDALAGVLSAACPGLGITPANVLDSASVDTTFNTATARAKGIEISGRIRARRSLYFDYSYDVESSIVDNVPNSVLGDNADPNQRRAELWLIRCIRRRWALITRLRTALRLGSIPTMSGRITR